MSYSAILNVVLGVQLSKLFPEGLKTKNSEISRTDSFGTVLGKFNLETYSLGGVEVGSNKNQSGSKDIDFAALFDGDEELQENWMHTTGADFNGLRLSEIMIGLRVDEGISDSVKRVQVNDEKIALVKKFLIDRFNYEADPETIAIIYHSY